MPHHYPPGTLGWVFGKLEGETMKTLDEQRRDTADRLTTDTGFEVSWMGSCFSLWDGSNRWFPLYTVAQVLNRAGRLKARRDLVEPTPESEAFEAAFSD